MPHPSAIASLASACRPVGSQSGLIRGGLRVTPYSAGHACREINEESISSTRKRQEKRMSLSHTTLSTVAAAAIGFALGASGYAIAQMSGPGSQLGMPMYMKGADAVAELSSTEPLSSSTWASQKAIPLPRSRAPAPRKSRKAPSSSAPTASSTSSTPSRRNSPRRRAARMP
jgi:hypothetical protein